ncbi:MULTISPECIES: amino acid ABC transporter permease [unclassified Clostridium]|uniref:amino acid ABC transporter permease n=1 Tax=unclassified Clostridium TaxID=2614128 RepID=UPI0025B9BE8C|nr:MULTISPECIES: amino acid ABC transporter permease [unclassified Clostridium]
MFDFNFLLRIIPVMLKYVKVTIALSLYSLFFGLILAIIIALIINAKTPILYPIAKVYVSFFRGTPLVAQLFFLYFGLIQLFPALKGLDGFTATVFGLSLNSAAYCSETLRGAIFSVDKGQMEAALAFGMTYIQAMRRIILPQAARVAIPALTSNFSDIVKGSSLAFTLGVTEIMASAQSEAASSYKFLEAYTGVVIVYWIIISCLGFIQKKLETTLNKAY